MDRQYLKEMIRRIEEEMAVHDSKFAGNPAHDNCLPRFEMVIARMKAELAKLEAEPAGVE